MSTVASWLQPFVIEPDHHRVINNVEGVSYPYVLIHQPPANMAPTFCVGRDEESGVYFISADVPEEYRFVILAHEMFEFGHLKQVSGSCQRALFYELSLINPNHSWEYVHFRGKQLQGLLRWMRRHPESYSEEQIWSTTENLRVLHDLYGHWLQDC